MKTAIKKQVKFVPFKRTISFLDKNRNRALVTVELTDHNNYPEATFVADINGHHGQCDGTIKPSTKAQRELIALWNKVHLKKVNPAIFTADIALLADAIEKHEAKRKGKSFDELEDYELVEFIQNKDIFSQDRDVELCAALVRMFNLSENDIEDVEIKNTRATVQGIDYIAGTDDECDTEWEADLDNYLDDCVLPDLPENMKGYFDRERWMNDAKMDGRGHSLNRYDGSEESYSINGTEYFAYRS